MVTPASASPRCWNACSAREAQLMKTTARIGRLWRTVRWLKAGQVFGRLRFRLQRPRPDLGPAPPQSPVAGAWVTPPAREQCLVGATRMRFLAEEHDLAEVGWDDSDVALLWRYNQHYFDDLNATGSGSRRDWQRALMQRWLDDNPPGQGTAWASYPVSLRIVNWVKWSLGGEPLTQAWQHSLAVQARWLTARLEWHLLGNHLFANAKALVFAGLFFDGAEAEGWLATGLAILRRELPEQVLADGGQFERTPMYHALALEDLLDLLNVITACAPATSPAQALVPELRTRSSAMLHWLRCLRHPGGALARFNDTAEGIAPATDDLERYAAAWGIAAAAAPTSGTLHLQPSGYVRIARGAAVALLDLALIGPDYLPGHAHADTLSFELSLGGRLVLVNRGTSVYGSGPRRQLERGTAAHNTVQIGDENSSEVWSGFRVGRRARPVQVHVDGFVAMASHDGYCHLPGRPTHRRRWTLEDTSLMVEDWLDRRSDLPAALHAVARFHLHPGLRLVESGPRSWQVMAENEVVASAEVVLGTASVERWEHALRFGELGPAITLAVTLDEARAAVRWHWNT